MSDRTPLDDRKPSSKPARNDAYIGVRCAASSKSSKDMGYTEKLKLLLWKNFSLKKRNLGLTLLEIFLPLLLFSTVIVLRSSIPVTPHDSNYAGALPLPSAGLIPCMQQLCAGNIVDQDGFLRPLNSVLDSLLVLLSFFTDVIYGSPDFAPPDLPAFFNTLSLDENPLEIWKKHKREFLEILIDAANVFTSDRSARSVLYRMFAELERQSDSASRFLPKAALPNAPDVCADPKVSPGWPRRPSADWNDLPLDLTPDEEKVAPPWPQDSPDSLTDLYAVLVAIWRVFAPLVCNTQLDFSTPLRPPSTDYINPYEFSFDDIRGRIVMALTQNPVFLYAPKDTEADRIMDKFIANLGIFEKFIASLEDWLELSQRIREELEIFACEYSMQWKNQSRASSDQPKSNFQGKSSTIVTDFLEEILAGKGNNATNYANNVDWEQILCQLVERLVRLMDIIDWMACQMMQLLDYNLNFGRLIRGFTSEQELIKYFQSGAKLDNATVLAGIVFVVNPDGSLPDHLRYHIRQNATISQTTRQIRSFSWQPKPDATGNIYLYNSFIYLQEMLERHISDVYTGDVDATAEPVVYIESFPAPCYREDAFNPVLEHMFPLAMMLGWVFAVTLLVRNVVIEKQNGLKEMMRVMGLRSSAHWFAWFIIQLAQSLLTVLCICLLAKYTNVLDYSGFFPVFFYMLVYALNAIMFAFFVSTLFSRAKIAATCAGIFFMLTYVPYMFIAILDNTGNIQPSWLKLLCSLFGTTALGLCGRFFRYQESMGTGIQWSNLGNTMRGEDDSYSLLSAVAMMMTSSVLYGILIWYMDNINPGQYGIPQPWYFPFAPTYWCGQSKQSKEPDGCFKTSPRWLQKLLIALGWCDAKIIVENQLGMIGKQQKCIHLEDEPTDLDLAVSIRNLSKVFPNGHVAVNNLSLSLYKGQILSFLGHNGAGKTTTMSMLTGMIPPSSGTAKVYENDIRLGMLEIRKDLGMCPQHNILFNSLSVEEHLRFYAQLKGTSKTMLDLEVEGMLKDTGLLEKRKDGVESLSGGMKRKLCIGIAFISGSRVVILDEPTAGIDPWSRREIWDLLLLYREDRTIMLSTHHMDEADILGDRIAVISHGSLKCCGSSLFLKSTYGEGYHLVIALKTMDNLSGLMVVDSSEFSTSRCRERDVTAYIQSIMPTAYLKSQNQSEIHYILPFKEIKTGAYGRLLTALETEKEDLFIDTFGVSDTSLEEVFLKVTSKAKSEERRLGCEGSEGSVDNVATTEVIDVVEEEMDVSDQDATTAASQRHRRANSDWPHRKKVDFSNLQRSHSYDLKSNTSTSDVMNFSSSCSGGVQEKGKGSTRSSSDISTAAGSEATRAYVTGWRMANQQFWTCMKKRVLFSLRNWKALMSQTVLPIIFITIAMIVGVIGGPHFDDLPSLDLDTAQFFNVSKMQSNNFVPVSNDNRYNNSPSATPDAILRTFRLPSGLGAACLLMSRDDNETIDDAKCSRFQYKDGIRLPPVDREWKPAESDVPYFRKCKCFSDFRGLTRCSGQLQDPPSVMTFTRDVIQDVTSQDLADFLHFSADDFQLSRYGALSFGLVRRHVPWWLNRLPLIKIFHARRVAKIYHNSRGWHSLPSFLNIANNAILRANLPEGLGHPGAYGITASNTPLPGVSGLSSLRSVIEGSELVISLFIITGFAFIPAGFILFLVYEKSSKAKHLQFVTGLNPVLYWVSNLLSDMVMYLLPAGVCLGVFQLFGIKAFSEGEHFLAVSLLIIIFGWGCTPVLYPATFFFDEASAAYVFLAVVNMCIGATLLFITFTLDYLSQENELGDLSEVLKKIFLVFPSFALGQGLINVVVVSGKNDFNELVGIDAYNSPVSMSVIGWNLLAMFTTGAICFAFTVLYELNFFIQPRVMPVSSLEPIEDEDADVEEERKHVLRATTASTDMLRLENLTKMYKTASTGGGQHLAVHRLCLAVSRGECFGMLGVNGAGKTTTFKMMTGDHVPSGGDAFVHGHSILHELKQVRKLIGYCPQFDALYSELTAREHLDLYARLRGIEPSQVAHVVDWAVGKLELTAYADRPVGTYSGGNKRKLSTAIALLGDPSVIFLDEPTAGMDPYAKRFLWDLVLSLIAKGKCIILTSHSMEECEILCTRLAIMVKGSFRCLGSVQHLKSKFGDGYTLKITVKGPNHERHIMQIIQFTNRVLPFAIIKASHHNMLEYLLEGDNVQLTDVFNRMEQAKLSLPVDDYSISQNTLDNVFINFVKEQETVSHSGQDRRQSIATSLLHRRGVARKRQGIRDKFPSAFSVDRGVQVDMADFALMMEDDQDPDGDVSTSVNVLLQ